MSQNKNLSETLFNAYPWTREIHDDLCSMTSKYALQWLEIVTAVDNRKDPNIDHIKMVQDDLKRTCEGWLITAENIYDKYIEKMGRCATRIEELTSKMGVDVLGEIEDKDIPLTENYSWLKTKLQEAETLYEEKEKESQQLREKYELLANKLGQSFRTLPHIMSPQTEENFKLEVESLEKRTVDREQEFKLKVLEIQSIMKDYEVQLDKSLQAKFLEFSNESFTITTEASDSLNVIHEFVLAKQQEIDLHIITLKKKLETLWDSLRISENEKISFLTSTEVPLGELVKGLSEEIVRLESYKQDYLEVIINENKGTLTNLWDRCHCGASIRNDFPEIYTNAYSEKMLDSFNHQIKKWEHFYNENSEIITTLNMYTKILKEAEELKVNKDSLSFYRNRGGKMMEQLKSINILKNRLKKTEEKLLKLSEYFFEKNGTPFLSFDRSIETIISSNVNLKKFVTEDPVKYAKSPRTPLVKTPRGSPFGVSPHQKVTEKKLKTPSSQQKRSAKKEIPKFKLNESKVNSPKTKGWKPSRVSLKLGKDSGDDSWTSDFSDFEKEIKGKNVPRSSSILK